MTSPENVNAANPKELVELLARNPDVLGILQYGAGIGPEAADADLCVVVAQRPDGLESIHFWLGSRPVDLNVRTLDDLKHRDLWEQLAQLTKKYNVVWHVVDKKSLPGEMKQVKHLAGDAARAVSGDE